MIRIAPQHPRLVDQLVTLALLVAAAIAIALMQGCAGAAVQAPQTLNQRIAVSHIAVTAVRESATELLKAKSISVEDAENVLDQTDAARKGLDLARQVAAIDPTAADAKLRATTAVLTALQAYLVAKQAR